ncbi:tuliposide A-converting enzyme 1, chloroplastic-like [Oryza brachyantha]|uniref:Alpha/beta hydrolase fold-3 domain-containing protein n=1 Tax=Oryza brachyantha TaxID=4533 RepID=J3MY81_ORYBR|nr:tuliposide A-converting enzyme 1, chloroplastic-like [Oryza brachyantha]
MASCGDIDGEVVFELAPFIRIFKGGRVERDFGSDPVPASTDAATGVASKDRAISPDVAVRLYLPPVAGASGEGGARKLPLLVYFHGGGFCLHTAFNAVFHAYLTSLAARTRAVVVSVDYRLAPEHPIPAAYEDSWQAVVWAASHASGAGEEAWLTDHADFSRMYLAGESAGANIAHNVAMRAGAEGLPNGGKINGVVLVHPYFLGRGKIPSEDLDPVMAENVVKMWSVVCPGTTGVDDPWINPLAGGAPALDGLACGRVLVCLAETDVIRDRGRAYCEGLKASGWPGELEVLEVAGHGHCFHLVDFNGEEAVKQDDAIAKFVRR